MKIKQTQQFTIRFYSVCGIIDIAYEYTSTSSFENGYIYIHCHWITLRRHLSLTLSNTNFNSR